MTSQYKVFDNDRWLYRRFAYCLFTATSRRESLKRHGNGCRHGSGRRCWRSSPPSPSPAPPELVRVSGRLVDVTVLSERASRGRQHVRPHELVFCAPPRRHVGRAPRGQGLPSPPCRGGSGTVSPWLAHRHRPLLSPADPLTVCATTTHVVTW